MINGQDVFKSVDKFRERSKKVDRTQSAFGSDGNDVDTVCFSHRLIKLVEMVCCKFVSFLIDASADKTAESVTFERDIEINHPFGQIGDQKPENAY